MGKLTMLKPKLASVDLRTAAPPPKVADEFYSSREWREARAECIRRAHFRCSNCPRVGIRLFADHITELKDGGHPTSQANLQALCGSCHTAKTAEARRQRVARPSIPTQGQGRAQAAPATSLLPAEGMGGRILPGLLALDHVSSHAQVFFSRPEIGGRS